MESAGIGGRLLLWFKAYLNDRRQRVVIPGATSEWVNIKAGVPQGSTLGPLLFLIYINDIVTEIRCTIRLFADDTSLYIIVDNPNTAAESINNDLQTITEWANQWLVKFNPNKTKNLLISRKTNRPQHPPIIMQNQQVVEVTEHKHLGIFISQDGTWHAHIDYITAKAWQRINIMRKLKFRLDRKSLQSIYIAFIRPVLEYADVVWDNCTGYELEDIEKIQIEAARIVTGTTKLVSFDALYTETGWDTLANRRHKHKLIMMYKMQNDLCPTYLSSLLPATVGNTTTYNLRNTDNTQTIKLSNDFVLQLIPAVNCPGMECTSPGNPQFRLCSVIQTPLEQRHPLSS